MFDSLKKFVCSKAAIATGAIMAGSSVFATEGTVTLPTTGVDVSAYASSAITSLGTVVAVCVGGYIAFRLIKMGLRWVGKIAG